MKTRILIFLIVFVILSLSLSGFSFAQEKTIKAPETLEEAKEMGERGIEEGKRKLPDIIVKIWKEEVLPVWKRMYEWFYDNIWLKTKAWFQREVYPRTKEELEQRKQIIKEEFPKERQELEEELPTLWGRFLELIK